MYAGRAVWLIALGVVLTACGADPGLAGDRSSLVPAHAATGGMRSAPQQAQAGDQPPGTPGPAVPGGVATAVGAGVIVDGIDNATFNFTVRDAAPAGEVTIAGAVAGAAFRLKGTAEAVTITDGRVVITGDGRVNGDHAFFTLRAQDGEPDALSVAITMDSWNIVLAGDLVRGTIAITPRP